MYVLVKCCGLFIDEKLLFLCSSPDELINKNGIVKVKCPYAPK